ncbi:hypothetical protein QBC42DRAFT_327799 [Cladorrhinum samala]|uniref:Uncharacterized protein n=1 Tax=Cladorrhinum samala TaxID=585594 RepID=A0AAV9I2L3_9PEZI|nr:hypothetical protein QBC42DRAFT_327799 [Cladorrhinum samala]
MKFSPVLLISAIFGSALADSITLPESLPNGSYLISVGADGKPTWTEVATANVTDTPKRDITPGSTSARLGKRFPWPSQTYPYCPGGDWFLLSDFYDHAWNAFYDSCYANGNHKFPQGTVFANYQGNAVAYMCAYSANPCSADEWVDAVNWVSSNCVGRSDGWMEPGYLHVPGWNKRYGYAKGGSSIC